MTKVLVVVEDDVDMRQLIRFTLMLDPRLEVKGEAASAREAIEIARSDQPELIILDHFIEGEIMGLEAAPKLKQVAPLARILLFTSHDLATEADREPAIDAYLRKDDLEDLLGTAQRLLGIEPVLV